MGSRMWNWQGDIDTHGSLWHSQLASREGLIGPANQPKTGNGGQDDVAPIRSNNRSDRSSRTMRLELED